PVRWAGRTLNSFKRPRRSPPDMSPFDNREFGGRTECSGMHSDDGTQAGGVVVPEHHELVAVEFAVVERAHIGRAPAGALVALREHGRGRDRCAPSLAR